MNKIKPILAVLVLAGITSYKCFSQVWVENYDYNGAELDSAKWTENAYWARPAATFSGYSMILQNTWRNKNMLGVPNSILNLDWYRTLPLNQDWTVFQRFKPTFNNDSWYKTLLSATVGSNTNPVNSIDYEFFLYGSDTSDPYNYFTKIKGQSINENWDYRWFGISYNSTSESLIWIFSQNSESNIPSSNDIQVAGTTSTAGSSSLQATITHYSTFYMNGEIEITDFRILPYSVPEPSSLSLLLAGGAVALARRRKV